ncbi:unnamed protein product [Phytophthora lilii]|uniref:Unnamed protein product n=1 Tax=Phytophthora lilii TaxID=2077276 RepID=A0A9W6TRW7_9STRA|nr:unnamed protein product [Phytophthora lilii]
MTTDDTDDANGKDKKERSKAAPSPVASSASYAPAEQFESSPAPSPRGSTTSPADKVEAASTLASLGGVDDATTNSTFPGVSIRILPPGKHPAWSPNDSSEGEPTGNEDEVGESSGDEVSRPCNANKVVKASDESDSEQTGRNAGQIVVAVSGVAVVVGNRFTKMSTVWSADTGGHGSK